MDNLHPSPFKNGYWIWDEVGNRLLFVSRDQTNRLPSLTNVSTHTSKSIKPTANQVRFRELVDNLEQVRFKRYYQRRCRVHEPQVVTIQDIKDITIFLCNAKDLSTEFIKYFHIPPMDRLLRALIVYFQYYLHVWDYLNLKREEATRKLYQPSATTIENVIRDDLADLRAMVAREYCSILTGIQESKKYHHMNNKNNDSLSDKDRRLFETLITMAVRVVWVALQRKHLSMIELEMNRLLRADVFNIISHRRTRGGISLSQPDGGVHILNGITDTEERKLLHRSPIAKELLLGEHDHRMLIIGTRQFEPTDDRLNYLEAAFSSPEEKLHALGIPVGMLGVPREKYDAMLINMEKSARKLQALESKAALVFKLPPRVHHSDDVIAKQFPQNPPKYKETHQTKRARKTQCKMWQKTIEKSEQGREISVVDMSISHGIVSSQTSLSALSKTETVQ